ncbi:hypothetical protein BSLG_006485 [Batrachochytrium salamandrivorans]|nr:hypothetical protein BSLG_006485 [Batrachochytrium salamandrivorans]
MENHERYKSIVEEAATSLRLSFEKMELHLQNQLLQDIIKADQIRINEMSRKLVQLAEFKQSVASSLSASQNEGLNLTSMKFVSKSMENVSKQSNIEMGNGSVYSERSNRSHASPTSQEGVHLRATLGCTGVESYYDDGVKSESTPNLAEGRQLGSDLCDVSFQRQDVPISNQMGFIMADEAMEGTLRPGIHRHQQDPPPLTVDGRDFFKMAQSNLSYNEFTALLWNVKAFNNREQTKLKMLQNLDSLFAPQHRYILDQFEKMVD